MTDDELRALVASNAQSIAETRAITDSNARAIAANASAIAELRVTTTQQGEQMARQNEQMLEGISEVVSMVGELAAQQEARHAESDQRFNNLLADARADRQRIDQALADAQIDRERADQNHAEAMQRIDQALEEARADRERGDRDRAINENEHRAFRETFQTLLAEVARIWQRLA